MYYFKVFYKILIKNPFLGFCYIVLSFILLYQIFSHLTWKSNHPYEGIRYFSLVVTNYYDSKNLMNKIDGLPGIIKIVDQSYKIKGNLKDLADSKKLNISKALSNDHFNAYKIYIKDEVDQKSFELLKVLISKYLDTQQLTIGPINKNKSKDTKNHLFILFYMILWILVNFFVKLKVRSMCKIIANIQRKSFIAPKVALIGGIITFIIGIPIIFNINDWKIKFSYLNLLYICSPILIIIMLEGTLIKWRNR